MVDLIKVSVLRCLGFLKNSILGILILLILYLLFAYVLSHISVNTVQKRKDKSIDVYILSNGVHTDLVLPVKNKTIDWRLFVPPSNTKNKDTTANMISFGWGDKGFYLNTPTWADLKFSTAFNAMFALSSSAIHTTYYHDLTWSDKKKKIQITQKEYDNLVKFIKGSFKTTKSKKFDFIPTELVYGESDAFYEAKGKYSLFQTCNSWANEGLKKAGQKAALWTALDDGIFRNYE
jgi:uncharacterized protein (TIGR02117 family)